MRHRLSNVKVWVRRRETGRGVVFIAGSRTTEDSEHSEKPRRNVIAKPCSCSFCESSACSVVPRFELLRDQDQLLALDVAALLRRARNCFQSAIAESRA